MFEVKIDTAAPADCTMAACSKPQIALVLHGWQGSELVSGHSNVRVQDFPALCSHPCESKPKKPECPSKQAILTAAVQFSLAHSTNKSNVKEEAHKPVQASRNVHCLWDG